MNSRKLAESWPWLEKLKVTIRERGVNLSDADTEQNNAVYQLIIVMLHKMLIGIDTHLKYLSLLPWALSRADTEEGAKEVMRQVRVTPWEQMDPLTRRVMDEVGADIDKVARGGPVSEALRNRLKPFKKTPLDESLGEGYHRDTYYEHTRASGSSTRHLKQHTRFKESLERCNKFVEEYGDRGSDVFRYEWRCAKRIVQTSANNRWHPVMEPMSVVLSRVYREDERAEEDFSAICNREAPRNLIDHDAVSGKEALRNEYLITVLNPTKNYSMRRSVNRIDEAGQPTATEEHVHFRLIGLAHGNRRPKRLIGADPDGSPQHEASLALLVVFQDRWVPPGGSGDEGLERYHVHTSTDPVRGSLSPTLDYLVDLWKPLRVMSATERNRGQRVRQRPVALRRYTFVHRLVICEGKILTFSIEY